jgi:hypothetical protein
LITLLEGNRFAIAFLFPKLFCISGECMFCLRHVACALILMLIIVQASCSGNSLLVDFAESKLSAAKYYYDQRDYPNARKNSSEALVLWKTVKERRLKSYPEWAVENNISACEEMLELIPASGPNNVTTIVPIRIVKGQIIVEALLNHREIATFILDTGAERTLITPELADRIKIKAGLENKKGYLQVIGGQIIEASFGTLPEIEIGDALVKNLTVGITSIMPDQPYLDGLLGADFLTNFTVTIDHGINKLKLVGR